MGSDILPAPGVRGGLVGTSLLVASMAAVLLLTVHNLQSHLPAGQWWQAALAPEASNAGQLLFHYGLLPRLAVSIAAGALLGLSGTLFGQILQNPLAEPSTLGTFSGAAVALVAATLYAPSLLDIGRFWIACAGAAAATLLVLATGWRSRLAPIPLILAGLSVGLAGSAAGGIMVLGQHQHLSALYLWQSGSLAQSGWGPAASLIVQLLAGLAVAILLVRPLTVLDLDETGARSLGVSVVAVRLAALAAAVWFAASVSASIGVVGFVGLAAPLLARLAGARRLPRRLLVAAAAGGLLVWSADQIVQSIGDLAGAEPPAGMLTGLLGAPLMLVLLPRLLDRQLDLHAAIPMPRRQPVGPLLALALLAILAVTLALMAGRGMSGWWWAGPGDPVLDWRAPRVAASFASGAALALAGMIMQRMTGNPMASPELLGVSSGAALGMVLVVLLVPELHRIELLGGAAAGALLVLVVIFLLGRRSSLSPERLLLTGVAMTTVAATLSSVVMLSGHPRLDLLLRMMAGSTYLVTAHEAAVAALVAAAGIAFVFLAARSLAILPLGRATAAALGLAIGRSRLWLLLIASLLTGAATLVVGPLSFVGLVAPHLVSMSGLAGPAAQGIGAALAGGILMALADWIGRNIVFPWQIPAGLLAALVCCPYFLWLVARRRAG